MKIPTTRKILTIIRQLKSKLNSLEINLIQSPCETDSHAILLSFKQMKQNQRVEEKVSIPAKKAILNLKEYWSEVVMEYYNPGDLPRSAEEDKTFSESFTKRVPSLMELASYGMGRIAIDLEEDEFEDFYEWVEPHLRSLVLFEHLVQILIRDMPLDILLPWFAEECATKGARLQALEVARLYFVVSEPRLGKDYKWAREFSVNVGYQREWNNFLADYYMESKSDLFFDWLDDDGSGVEIAEKILYNYEPALKTGLVIDFLIRHCVDREHLRCSKTKCECYSLLQNNATTMDLINHAVESDDEVLFSLYFVAALSKSSLSQTRESSSIPPAQLVSLENCSMYIHSVSLSTVLQNFTLEQIYTVALLSKSNFEELSEILIAYAVNTFKQNGDQVLISELESDLKNAQSGTKWRYEVIADTWIPATPHPITKPKPIFVPPPDEVLLDTPFKKPIGRVVDFDPLTAPSTIERIRRAMVDNRSRNANMTPRSNLIPPPTPSNNTPRPSPAPHTPILTPTLNRLKSLAYTPCKRRKLSISLSESGAESPDPLAIISNNVIFNKNAKVLSSVIDSEDDILL